MTSQWTPIVDFYGVYEGRGFAINGLSHTIDQNAINPIIGFFSRLRGESVIKDVRFIDVNFSRAHGVGHNSTTGLNVGGITGRLEDSAQIINCFLSGTISVRYSLPVLTSAFNAHVGGLVGYSEPSATAGLPTIIPAFP